MRGHVDEDLLARLVFRFNYESFLRLNEPTTFSIKNWVTILVFLIRDLASVRKSICHAL